MLKHARNPSGCYASQFDDALIQGSNSRYLPKPKPAAMGVYEVERIVAKRFQGVKAEYLIKWKNFGTGLPLARRTYCRLWKQIHPGQCDLSWYAVRPPWDSIPRHRSGADKRRSGFFSQEMFDSKRGRLSCQHSCQPEVVTCHLPSKMSKDGKQLPSQWRESESSSWLPEVPVPCSDLKAATLKSGFFRNHQIWKCSWPNKRLHS